MIRDLWFVTRGSCIVTRDGKELGEIPKWKSWTCERMSFDTPLGEWENRTGGTPPGFFGTNWGSDRKERRWEGGCTENTGNSQWLVAGE